MYMFTLEGMIGDPVRLGTFSYISKAWILVVYCSTLCYGTLLVVVID